MLNQTPCTTNLDLFTYDIKYLGIVISLKTKKYIHNCNHCYYCQNMMRVHEILFVNLKLDENVMTICICIIEVIFQKLVKFALLER